MPRLARTPLGVESRSARRRLSPRSFAVVVVFTFVTLEVASPCWGVPGPRDLVVKHLVLFMAVPLMAAIASGRLDLMGLRFGNRTLFFTLVATLAVLPFYVGAALLFDSMRDYYPVWALEPSLPSLARHFLLIGVVILGTEILYRGLMVLALREYGLAAVLVHLVPYVYIHVGKPLPEMLASAVAGLFWGIVALESDSIIPSTVSHAAGYFVMDLLIVLGVQLAVPG
jgi:hypothetical protein